MKTEQENPNGIQGRDTVSASSGDVSAADPAALLALFRLLLREPPADHDFITCPICKEYGITGI